MSRQAEHAVLGAILTKPEAYWLIADTLSAGDFTTEHNRALFATIVRMLAENRAIDPLTLADKENRLDVHELVELAANSTGAANIRGWAEIVAQASEKRRLDIAGRKIASAENFAEAQRILADVQPKSTAKLITARDAAKAMWDRLDERYNHDGTLRGISSGVDTLDQIVGGYRGGQLIVVAGRPGMGKSLKIVQMAKLAGRCLVLTMEMTAGELMERMLSNTGNIPVQWLKFPKQFDAELFGDGTLTHKIAALKNLDCVFDDRTSLTIEDITALARQQHMISPLKAVVIDHLGKIKLPQRERHDLAIGAVTDALKNLAKELDIPVILLSQLNRKVDERPDKRPILSDLRNSGDIEQDADVVIIMYRPEYYQLEPKGFVEFIVAKQRDGETGSAFAETRMATMQFIGCEPPEYRAPEKRPSRGGFN